MNKTITSTAIAITLLSCNPVKRVVKNEQLKNMVCMTCPQNTHEQVTIKERIDTFTFYHPGDTMAIKALIHCDSNNFAQMEYIDKIEGKLRAKAKIVNNVIYFDCQHLKDSIQYYRTRKDTAWLKSEEKIIFKEVPNKRFDWWLLAIAAAFGFAVCYEIKRK